MYDGRRRTNRCLTSYRATKTHCSEKGNYWNFTLFWGIRVRESPGFFFLHQNCPWNQYTYVILIGIVSIALTGWIL